ncbi:enamine deaminase RidA (YjgF/YER057c/UK114 family) [Halopolyspora algeriensis]|uniref:Enamine deaminase RidA (YjgF/YER057c/UK114 family) n=1 Tax=Halopolyspora algeriensis TaxID=1500506 RepID=A0A368VVB5_9ACTN|nr:RidA family protein [Halopolyspora algeriensis]RCW45835.1 enamine deaminase RidA (YjgF/YER057c/UK114 family) [Halopolyspora algeriensis]TQM55250.1 enamine deaminase RidA (YjgF/YER057c/UK114 family) [Halopolyspora algeriensis]
MPEPLPEAPAPQGTYGPALVHAGIAFSAGMTPRVHGELAVRGIVGRDLDVAAAQSAAAIAARNALAAITGAAGGLERIERCLRLSVFVACTDEFRELSAVADGATAAIAEHTDTAALPVRSAIGVRSLPSGAPVEVELTAAVSTPP